MVRISFRLRKGKKTIYTCGDCAYFDETASYCKKMWAPVTSHTEACRHFKPKSDREVIGSEHG